MEALFLGGLAMPTIELKVSNYTKDPFGRYLTDGPGNGTEYRRSFILPELRKGNDIVIDLDGIHDEYGSSFIVEAFANLIRKEGYSYEEISSRISFRSENQEWIDEINYYIEEAKTETQGRNTVSRDNG